MTIDAWVASGRLPSRSWTAGLDYVLAVKENQGQLHDGHPRPGFAGAELGFDGVPYDYSQTVNKGHDGWNGGNAGPSPRRTAWTTSTPTGNGPN